MLSSLYFSAMVKLLVELLGIQKFGGGADREAGLLKVLEMFFIFGDKNSGLMKEGDLTNVEIMNAPAAYSVGLCFQ